MTSKSSELCNKLRLTDKCVQSSNKSILNNISTSSLHQSMSLIHLNTAVAVLVAEVNLSDTKSICDSKTGQIC